MGQLGLPEMIIIGIIALLIFGPKKLPDLGSGLGKAIRDFKSAMSEPEPPAKDEKAKDEKKEEKKEEPVTKS
jgi:sec-independent protein translocase protein TatA